MTLNLLMLLIALAFVLGWRKRRRSSRVVAGVAVLFLLAVGCGPLPALLLGRLQADVMQDRPADWGARNVIVLLGAGTVRVGNAGPVEASLFAYGRINRAVTLYRSCKAAGRVCKLEVSGGDARGLGQSEADVYGQDIRRLGVIGDDLLLESNSMNTWQNAQFSRPLLDAESADRVFLVSSGFHLRRGLLYFRAFWYQGDTRAGGLCQRGAVVAAVVIQLHHGRSRLARVRRYRAVSRLQRAGLERYRDPARRAVETALPERIECVPATGSRFRPCFRPCRAMPCRSRSGSEHHS